MVRRTRVTGYIYQCLIVSLHRWMLANSVGYYIFHSPCGRLGDHQWTLRPVRGLIAEKLNRPWDLADGIKILFLSMGQLGNHFSLTRVICIDDEVNLTSVRPSYVICDVMIPMNCYSLSNVILVVK